MFRLQPPQIKQASAGMDSAAAVMSHPDTTVGAVASILIVTGASLATWTLLMWLKNRPARTCNCNYHACRTCKLQRR